MYAPFPDRHIGRRARLHAFEPNRALEKTKGRVPVRKGGELLAARGARVLAQKHLRRKQRLLPTARHRDRDAWCRHGEERDRRNERARARDERCAQSRKRSGHLAAPSREVNTRAPRRGDAASGTILERRERRHELRHRLVAILPALRHRLGQHVRERHRQVRRNLADWRGHLGDGLEDERLRRPFERRAAREHSVPDRGKRVLVAARVQRLLAHGLFGTHVVQRADDHAGTSESMRLRIRALGDAKIHHHHGALRALQHDVLRLHVAMHDARTMRRVQREGCLTQDADGLQYAEAAVALDHRGQAIALDERHGEIHEAAALAHRVDGNHVRMSQLGDGFRLALKPFEQHLVHHEVAANGLDGDLALQALVIGDVHFRKSATTE